MEVRRSPSLKPLNNCRAWPGSVMIMSWITKVHRPSMRPRKMGYPSGGGEAAADGVAAAIRRADSISQSIMAVAMLNNSPPR